MQKKSLTNKITPCCNLPFSVMYFIVENLTLTSDADRTFIKNNLHQNGTLSIDAWKVWINSGTLESDASLTKVEFLAWFDCERQPSCAQLKMLIEGFKLGNYNPLDEYGVGWTESFMMEEYNGKLIKKITGYVGGIGALPNELNDRVNLYYGDEILTDNKDLAIDFRGQDGANGTAEIPDWIAGNYVEKSLTFKDNAIWRVADGQTAGVGDVPGVSAKWKSLGSDDEDVRKALKWFLEQQSGGTEVLDKTFEISNTASYGNLYGVASVGGILQKTGVVTNYVEAGVSFNVWKNIPTRTNGIKKIIAKLTPYGNPPANLKNANIIGTKTNGDVIPLVMHIGTQPPSTLQTYELDITEYESISVGMIVVDANPNSLTQTIEFYKVVSGQSLENSVKKYIDEKILPIKSFSDGSVNPKLLETYDKTKIVTNPFINGVQNYLNNILLANNTIVSYTEAGVQFYIWKDVPTKINGTKRIVKLDLDFTRIGGTAGSNTNLLGIKKDGTIVNIVPSQSPTPTGKLEKISIDLKPYEKFSLQLVTVDSNPDSPKIKIKTYENGEIEEDSVLKFIEENGGSGGGKIISENLLMIDKPTSAPIINIVGELPTDASPTRTPTNIEFEYIMNNRIVFKCKSTLAIQGNATATFAKKGFETAFKNYNDTELKVQFGEWAAFSEFHLKAYPNDQTFARDLTAGKLWHQIRKNNEFPKSYIADFNGGKLIDSNKENLQEQSLFFTDGFPIELRVNGVFHGLYILRIKKDRDNYMMNNANPNHIFFDNEEGVNWTTFTPSNWKLRSPKVSGGFTNTVLLGKMNRWWDWFKGINDNTIDFESTVENYLNIESWVDDIILQQVTAHWDYQVNNILLTSWDGLKLSICYYDGDQTFGFVLNSMGGFEFPLTVDSNGLYWRSDFWREKLYPKLLSRIKTRYTELRNNKILNSNNVYQLFKETTDMIPRDLYEKEMNAWRLSRPDEGIHNVRYCMNWFKERLVKLDLIWKL